jgi:RHS repeat-associated protein
LPLCAGPDGTTQRFLRDAEGNFAGRYDNGAPSKNFIRGINGKVIAGQNAVTGGAQVYGFATGRPSEDFINIGGTLYRVVTDQLGSPRLVIRVSDGVVVDRIDYDEWGQVSQDTSPGFQSYGFAGSLGFDKFNLLGADYRLYDSKIGRWTNKDPIGFSGGDTNLYGYVLNDPVNYIDPDGTQSIDPFYGEAGKDWGKYMACKANPAYCPKPPPSPFTPPGQCDPFHQSCKQAPQQPKPETKTQPNQCEKGQL